MVILLADAFASDLPSRLRPFGEVVTDLGRVSEAEVIIVRSKTKVDKAMIDAAPKLKYVIRGGVGVDTIDVDYAKSKGIVVDNTPEASSLAVAELAFALMISLPNHIAEADASMKQGSGSRRSSSAPSSEAKPWASWASGASPASWRYAPRPSA